MNPVTYYASAILCGLIIGDAVVGKMVDPVYLVLAIIAVAGVIRVILSRSL